MPSNSFLTKVLVFACAFFIPYASTAQELLTPTLDKNYREYEVETIDTDRLYDQLKDRSVFHQISISVGKSTYDLKLWDSGIRSDDYKVTLASGKPYDSDPPVMLRGHLKDDLGADVRLTINRGFVFGFITINGRRLNVQPARYYDDTADEDLMVFYYDDDVNETLDHHSCGVTEQFRKGEKLIQPASAQKSVGLCYEIEMAFAADWSMVVKHGASGTENHVLGVLNGVEANYDDEFADEILFDDSDFFISDCDTCDPWTNSLDIGSLLNDFSGWAPNEFGSHEIGSLWSNRNFSGTAVGVAWLGGACNGSGYNVCEDFTNNSNLLRVVLAHEIGHNLNAEHDGGGGLIMSSSVSNTSSWSTQSETDILNHMAAGGCFIDCSSGNAPSADFDFDIVTECVPGEVEFFDDSDDATAWLWTFPGGTPNSSTDQNPVVTYNNSGEYDVTLEVTNPFGSDSKTENNAFMIIDLPFAEFQYDTDELEANFFDLSTGGPGLTYYWDFGDGNTSTLSEPDHYYNTTGTYTVTLEVENNCDLSIYTEEITIYDDPEAQFVVDYNSGCAQDPFNFIDQSYGNITEWQWTFPGGTPASSTLQNPQVTYAIPGFYDVTLEVSNPEGGNSVTQSNFITILDVPVPEFEFVVNNNTVAFTNTTRNFPANIYSWEFGDGNSSTETSPVHTYANSGNYVAILIAENDCASESQAAQLSISIKPIAQIGTSNSLTSGCATHVINYVDNSQGSPTTWNWSFPGGNPASSTAQNPTVSYTQEGNYDVTLSVSNAFGSDSISLTSYVTVDDVPQLSATHGSDLLTTTFSSTTSNATSVSWNFGDGNSSSLENPTHTYAVAGTYNASVSASNNCGTVTENLTVTVTENPVASIGSNIQSGCAPLTINYLDNSTGNPTAWNWTFPGGTPSSSTDRHPAVSYAQMGEYDVTLQVSNAAGTDVTTLTQYMHVNAIPQLSAGYTSNLLQVDFTSTYSNASSVTWNFGDGFTSVEDNPSHHYPVAGTYNVTVTASNICGTVTENLTVTVDLGPTAGINSDLRSGCAPLTINFQDASSSNTTAWNWRFPGGNPASSTEQNPTVTYPSAGQYDVRLDVSNPQGTDSQTWTEYISVTTTPTASYDVEVAGNVVTMTNTTPGTTASWAVSDGVTSTLQTFTHVLSANGTYQIDFSATNECGSSDLSFDVVMDAYPASGFTLGSTTSGCAPLTVEYISTASQATNFSWSFPGGVPSNSTDPNPVIIYSSAGNYDVRLEVSNQYGSDATTLPSAITVTDVPVMNFESESNGSLIRFSNTSSGGTSNYSWDFGDTTTSTLENPTHTYTEPGSYIVSFTAINDCGSATLERVVIVDFSTPTIGSSFSLTSGCVPLEVQITDQSSNNPTAWSWEFPGGSPASSTDQNPVVTYNTPGVYSIIAVVSNQDGSSSLEYTDAITVADVPFSEFDIIQDSENITVINNSSGATSYSWDFGDGTTSIVAEPSHTYVNTGDYEIILSATNDCGTVQYSQMVSIQITNTDDFELDWSWSLSPNPTIDQVSLLFEQPIVSELHYEILDLMGRTINQGYLAKGTREKNVQLHGSGIYLVVIRQGVLLDVKKLMVVE